MIKHSPGLKLLAFIITGAFFVAFAVHISLQERLWGGTFEVGTTIESSHGSLTFEPIDKLSEPGEIEDHAELNRFFDRQDQMVHIATDDFIKTQNVQLYPKTKRISDLPPLFWIQIFVGFGSLIISGWIWALRSKDLASSMFAMSGISMFMSAIPSAIYTTRALAIPSSTFRVLENLNALGASLFGISILALFLIYPVRILHWKRYVLGECLFFGIWTVLFLYKLTPSVLGISVIMVLEMLAICFAIGAQFIFTKNNPQARAILTWLGLSVLMGAGAFIVFNTVPLVLGLTPLNQGYAFAFFLIIYLGLAAGITRFRLFEVGQWAFRFLFYAAGAIVLVLLDAALIYILGVSRLPALGLALLAVGLLYLPLRDYLWNFFSSRRKLQEHKVLQEALTVAFAPTSFERAKRWGTLLKKLFDPLEIENAKVAVDTVKIENDGLTLFIPKVADLSALKLSYPWSGRSLFTTESRDLAAQIVMLVNQAESSRSAYDRGVSEERRRMAQDLHDDVGARLLTGLYIADEKLKPTLQGALSDIRAIVSGMTGEKITLERLLADLRHEAIKRFETTTIKLSWPLSENEMSSTLLDYRQHKAIASIVREVISNVIRHSGADNFEITVVGRNGQLQMTLTDNGKGFSEKIIQGESQGMGLKSMRKRMNDLGGHFSIESMPGKSSIKFTTPLN